MSAAGRVRDEFARAKVRRPLRVLGASGQLGYGIPTTSFQAGVERKPDLIGCDMGSIDIGPYYLGSGNLATSPRGAKRDLSKVLLAARQLDVPLVIGSAGSAGAKPHLDQTLAMVRDIARTHGLRFRLGVLRADIPKTTLLAAVRSGEVESLDGMPELTEEEITQATNIVGQMGTSSFERALSEDIDVLIAGRACDTAIFAALPSLLGFPTALAMHMAKIIECASLCCVPGGRDSILATLDDEGFELESMAQNRRATPSSVAAHSLYEQGDPFTVHEPDGTLHLRNAKYERVDDRRTRVSGAVWEATSAPKIKIEGARLVGQRAVLLCGAADPRFIARHKELLQEVDRTVRDLVCEDQKEDYSFFWRVYGVDGVRQGACPKNLPSEVFLLGECLAPTPERAAEVVRSAKQYLLHYGYPGRQSTAGNTAFPFTPPEVTVGPAYRFNIFHLMKAHDLTSLFPLEIENL